MESFIRSPEPLKDNKPSTWIIWKEEFLIFMGLLNYMERPQSFKANLFKNLIGSIGLATINKLSFEHTKDKENLDILLKKLDNYYNPEETEAQKRYEFFKTTKKHDETMENYIQKLKKLAQVCNFGNIADSLVRDVIILHTTDKELRMKYLQDEDINCDKIIAIYKDYKIHEQKSKTSNNRSQDSKEENKKKEGLTQPKECVNVMSSGNCSRCRTKHPIRQCPAWNYKCTRCSKFHHFEKCCKNVLPNVREQPLAMNNLSTHSEKEMKEKKVHYNIDKSLFGK